MSKHAYTYYVGVKASDRCQCGKHKARHTMLCSDCIYHLPRGSKGIMADPYKAKRFEDVIRAYDLAVADLGIKS